MIKVFDLVPSWAYAGAVAALSGCFLWQGSQMAEERLQWAEIQRDAAIAARKSIEVAQADTIRMQGERDAAVKKSMERRAASARDAVALDGELDGLRNELDLLRAALPSDTREACVARADALAGVFEACVGEYRSLAKKAQGHLDDALTLDQAWPSPGQSESLVIGQ